MKKIALLTLMLLSAVQGMEDNTTTTTTATLAAPAVFNPANSYESGKELSKPWFEETLSDSVEYGKNPTSALKHKIVMDLNHLMLSNDLKNDQKGEAIKIAKGIDICNLKVRLDAYYQNDLRMGRFKALSSELIHQIIEKVLEGREITDIKPLQPLLLTSKGFNLLLLSQPIITPYYTISANQKISIFIQIAELFPRMMRMMRKLELHFTKITDAELGHLRNFPQLTELILAGCDEITGKGLEHLKVLTQLTKLSLVAGCQNITDAGLEHLKVLTHLTDLELEYCRKITDAAVQGLQKALPNLKISYVAAPRQPVYALAVQPPLDDEDET